MSGEENTPFPFEAVRDLLGILRALYAAEGAHGGRTRRRGEILWIARELTGAVEQARSHAPGTRGHAAAWARAEQATTRLVDLVDLTTPLKPTLLAAGDRIRPKRVAPSTTLREAARRARLVRS